jgi:SAM-dependent methyltransferase
VHANLTAEAASELAADAAFLEMAEELGISALLDRGVPFTVDEAAHAASSTVPEAGMASFLAALEASGLVTRIVDDRTFAACADIADRRRASGYIAWAMNANRPYLANAPEFLSDYQNAVSTYSRDGRWVALSTQWIASQDYPRVFAEIARGRPGRVVDLGAGAGALLIGLLRRLPKTTAVAVDLSPAACAEASMAAGRAQVADRLEVVNQSVQSLIDDPSPLAGADVVHAAFVMHDLFADAEVFDGVLRACRSSLAHGGKMVIIDAVPYSADLGERAFSALFTYLHKHSMGVELPTQDRWEAAFRRAGFTNVACIPLPMPACRMFLASDR